MFPINAAIILQHSQGDGFPYCLTLASHFLHIVDVFPLLLVVGWLIVGHFFYLEERTNIRISIKENYNKYEEIGLFFVKS